MSKYKGGIVAAGHEVTAQMAVDVMKEGGNAFDAAVAAIIVGFNSEPCMSSPGGGGFANIFTKDGHSEILDFFCQTPIHKLSPEDSHFYPFTINFGEAQEDFYIGHGSHAVPGVLAGAFKMHELYGRLPLKTIFEPIIDITKKGIPLDPFQHMDIVLLENMMNQSPRATELYFNQGQPLQVGETLLMPQLADFLDAISREGTDLFYKGEIAQKICEDSQQMGGNLRREDFENYKVIRRNPIQIDYKGKKVHTTTFPSLGGAIIALGLGELSRTEEIDGSYLSQKHLERIVPILEKMEFTHRNPQNLIRHLELYENILFSKKWGSTTHFSILDGEGNAVAVTLSNGEGSGYMIPGTDCLMNNMLGEAALLPEGYFSWKENSRLFSLMSPTIVSNGKGEVEIITGTGGAGRIPGAIFQVIHYLLDYGLDVEQAVHAPRMHLTEEVLNVEPGFYGKPRTNGNYTCSVWEKSHMYFGGVHTIQKSKGKAVGVGDKRRYGVVREVI